MKPGILGVILVCGTMLVGCVTKGTHEATLTDLDQAQKALAKNAAEFDSFKKQSAAQIAALEADKSTLSNDLLASQTASAKLQRELDKARSSLDTTLASRNDMEQDVRKIRAETSGIERLNGELRREREQLQDKLDALQKNYDATKQDLETKLKAEQDTVAALQNDKQLLIARATGATDELAKSQKRMGELETDASRAKDLEQRLSQLQKRTGELETDASRAKDLEQRLSQRDIELGKLTQGGETLAAEKERLAAEKERLEKERAAKQAEIDRLTKTQQELTKSLQAEIERGDITIKQVRDRLTINMVEKVLFNSGQAQVKPAGLKVLTQVSDVLKNVTDKQIRIEGHTDNVPIGVKLQEKFPTNWELSTARATNVVRFFIERGGVNRERLEAVGFADTRPVASNDTEAGRTDNRRIEIVLYPKDLSEIVGEAK
jgi:chemotaxis protein MotB